MSSSDQSSALITAPLSILKSVKTIRDTQFRDLDFVAMEEFLHTGAFGLLKKTGAYGDALGTASALDDGVRREAEERVDRTITRYLDATLPRLTAHMESTGLLLSKYTTVLEETKTYVEKQRKHCEYLIGHGATLYIAMVVFFTYKVAQTIRNNERGIPGTLSSVSKWYVAFLAFHFVFHSLLLLLLRRKRRFSDVNFGVLNRVDQELAKNVFVRFSAAYAMGTNKEFVNEEFKRRSQKALENLEDAETSVVARACDGESRLGGGSGGLSDGVSVSCVLNACDEDNNLEDTLREHLKTALTNRKDSSDFVGFLDRIDPCAAALVVAVKNFAEIQRGNMFGSSDVRDNWQSVVRGMDDIRLLVLRELDVPPAEDPATPLEVVKDEIIPYLRLTCAETATLKPLDRNTDSFRTKFVPDLDKGVCWERARNTEGCRWAYFVPGKGCVYATEVAGYDTSDPKKLALEWCPDAEPPRYRSAADFPTDPSDEEFDKGVLLLTLTPAMTAPSPTLTPEDVLFVTLKGSNGVRAETLKALTPMTTQTSTEGTTGDALNRCAKQTSAGDNSCAAVSNDEDNTSSVPMRWRHDFTQLSYERVFEERPEDDAQASDKFYVKQSRKAIFEGLKQSQMATTMRSLRSHLVAYLVDRMKFHKNRVNVREYAEYIHGKLRDYYGAESYTRTAAGSAVGDVVAEILKEVEKTMESQGEGVSANEKYVSALRFSEKMRAMDDRDLRDATVHFGSTAYASMQLFREAQRGATEGDTNKSLASKVLELLAIIVLTILCLIFLIYVSNRVSDMLADRITSVKASSLIMLAFMALLLLAALISSMLVRKNGNDKFNRRISEENSRMLVTSVVDARDYLIRDMEVRARKRLENTEASEKTVADELHELYVGANHPDRSRALKTYLEGNGDDCEENCDLLGFLPPVDEKKDHEQLYIKLRRTVDSFDRCNTLIAGPRQAPFPVFEVTMYSAMLCLVLAALAFMLTKLKFFRRLSNVGRLGEAKTRANRHQEYNKSVVKAIIADSKVPELDKDVIMWVVVFIICLVMVFTVHVIIKDSQGYERGLYASSMYVNNRCTRSRREETEN